MSTSTETTGFDALIDEMRSLKEQLSNLRRKFANFLSQESERESFHRVSLTRETFNIQMVLRSLHNDLIGSQSVDSSADVNHMWHMIELHSSSTEAVIEGTHLLERFFKVKMRLLIQPKDYHISIAAYVRWQNETVINFVERYQQQLKDRRHEEIEHLWNWNNRANERMFFGGAARPLHLKKVTEFAALLSIYHDTLWPVYKENRGQLVDALYTLLREESSKYWPDYDIFPCSTSDAIMDKCLQYFFFNDRRNTWFVNSSGSDYIPFVNSARDIFAEKFKGSHMISPDQHTTEWILDDLKQRCKEIYDHSDVQTPPIVILLTSKNRFGQRINVDLIHSELARRFPSIVTIVDGCQDGQAFTDVDIAIYTKRFTSLGAIGLVNKILLAKHPQLRKKLTVSTTFPVGILAQLYINVNMINIGLAHGVEDLVNSAWWRYWRCPIQVELHSAIAYPYMLQNVVDYKRGPIQYTFTEDLCGTILMITTELDGQLCLPKLWALLKKQGHSVDCFVMDNKFLKSDNAIDSTRVHELMRQRFISALRELEGQYSNYLAWPLVPFWVSSPGDMSVEQLHEHFKTCRIYHCCLRISVGRCSYPGKLKRFVDHINGIFERNELDVSDDSLGQHCSQWLS